MKRMLIGGMTGLTLSLGMVLTPAAWAKTETTGRLIDCKSKQYEIRIAYSSSLEHGVVIESASLSIDGKLIPGTSVDSNGSVDVSYQADGGIVSRSLYYPTTFGIMASTARAQYILDIDSEMLGAKKKGQLVVVPFMGVRRSIDKMTCTITKADG